MARWVRLLGILSAVLIMGFSGGLPFCAYFQVNASTAGNVEDSEAGSALLVCSVERPTVSPTDSIRVKAWVRASNRKSLKYSWHATGGSIDGVGREARWSFKDVSPGTYRATVRVSGLASGEAECAVSVVVMKDKAQRGRETGWTFLTPKESEAEGYGLYSYVLFGSMPTEANRAQYEKVIEAYLLLIPHITDLEKALERRKISRSVLNVTYLPITEAPPDDIIMSVDWVLKHYDYATARILLRLLSGDNRHGPYIVSSLVPLGKISKPSGKYLYQDLSLVPPRLVQLWANEFLSQAAQERFWEERAAIQLVLKLRTTVAVLAEALPVAQGAVDNWIAWITRK